MKRTKMAAVLVGCTVIGLAACSSSSGDGSQPPRNTTVIVPPQSSVTTIPGYSNTAQ